MRDLPAAVVLITVGAMRLPLVLALLLPLLSKLPAQTPAEAAARHAAIDATQPVMVEALAEGRFEAARALAIQAITWEPREPGHRYNLACIEARAGKPTDAFVALDTALALGFNDAALLEADEDLASLHALPRWHAIMKKLAGESAAPPAVPVVTAESPRPAQPPAPAVVPRREEPKAVVPAAPKSPPAQAAQTDPAPRADGPLYRGGVPSGVFLMSRYWFATRHLEKSVWYFAEDGTAYEGLRTGLSARDLAEHKGRRGRASATDNFLKITWADGKSTESEIERGDTGFNWDTGLFARATPMPADRKRIAGRYEGGLSSSFGGSSAATVQTLELLADGTYRWAGVGSVSAASEGTRMSAGSSTDGVTGRWQAEDYTLVLTDQAGVTTRRISFPFDDAATAIYPDRLAYGDLLMKRLE